MNPDNEKRLEQQIDAALRGLPEANAPAELIPRVMAALERSSTKPWWQQSWFAWPVAAQVSSLVLWVGILVGVSVAGSQIWFGFQSAWSESILRDLLISFAQALGTSLKASIANHHVTLWMFAGGIAAMVGAMYLVCVGVGTAYYRAFIQRR